MATATVVLAACLLVGLILGPAAEAGSKCFGRHATIVSNAKVIHGTRASDVIVAGNGNSKIDGGKGSDRICAGGGNDTITGFRGRDRIDGEGGNDKIDGGDGTDELEGGGGTDSILGGSGNETIDGGPGNGDFVDEGPGDGNVSGGGGSFDIVLGGVGGDKVSGGPGAHDIASYSTATTPLNIDLGSNSVSGAENERLNGIEDALGGGGNDTLTGSAAANRLDGGPGDDTLRAVGQGDKAYGGPGSDNCKGKFASENSCGNEGTRNTAVDLIQSITGASSLIIDGTGSGEAVTVSRSGNNYTISSSGPLDSASRGACDRQRSDVVCTGSIQSVAAAMGGGNDRLTLKGVRDPVLADGGLGSDTLRGGSDADVLNGGEDNDPDTLFGGGGNDILFAIRFAHPRQPSGTGRMFGGGGSDLLVGGQPCDGDTFDGGPGRNDSASFARVKNNGIVVSATIGGAVTNPDEGPCNAGHIDGSIEKIEGSSGSDRLTGDNGNNDLLGRGGNDLLNGRGGRDTCIGGGGNDRAVNCEHKGSL